jgi:predicted deacylase
LQMRTFKSDPSDARKPIFIRNSKWIRASHSGMFCLLIENGAQVEVGTVLGIIADPFGKIERKVKSNISGYAFCVNETPVVNKGDALFHIGAEIENPLLKAEEEL